MTDKSVGREDSRYFGWAIWFWTVFCKQWVWQTFCKNWIWQTFCKTWIWKGLRLNVAFDNYDKWKGWVYLSSTVSPAMRRESRTCFLVVESFTAM